MEEKFRARRILFILLIVFGALTTIGSFGLLVTGDIWTSVLITSIIGFLFFIIGLIGYTSNRRDYKKYLQATSGAQTTSRADMRLSDIDIERIIDEASVIDLEQFEKEKIVEYDFKYKVVQEIPKNAICMISKTPIEKEESVLQCPNCQNYYLTKYLLGWLHKNSKCPICQFDLKTKKV